MGSRSTPTWAQSLRFIRQHENEIIERIDGDAVAAKACLRLYSRKLLRDGIRLTYSALPARLRGRLKSHYRFIDIAADCDDLLGDGTLFVAPEREFADEQQERARRVQVYAMQWAQRVKLYVKPARPEWGNRPKPVVSDRGERFPSITAAAKAMQAKGFKCSKSDIRGAINRYGGRIRIARRHWYFVSDARQAAA